MSKIPIDWKEWVVDGTANGKRLDDLIEVARQMGRRLARRTDEAMLAELAKGALKTGVDAEGRKG